MAPDINNYFKRLFHFYLPLKFLCLGSDTIRIISFISNALIGCSVRIRNVVGAALFLILRRVAQLSASVNRKIENQF